MDISTAFVYEVVIQLKSILWTISHEDPALNCANQNNKILNHLQTQHSSLTVIIAIWWTGEPTVFDINILAMSIKQSIWIHKLHIHISFMPLLYCYIWNDANTLLHVLLRKIVALLKDLELIVGQTYWVTIPPFPDCAIPDILTFIKNILSFNYSNYHLPPK